MMEAGLLDQNRSSILGNDDIQPPPDSRRSEDPPYKQMSDDPAPLVREEPMEDWDDDELTNLLKTYKDKMYRPYLNGILNKDYVNQVSALQKHTTASGDMKKQIIPPEIVNSRTERILNLDLKNKKEAETVSCLDHQMIEESIQRSGNELQTLHMMGEEVLTTLNCVAFLNAPQAYKNLQGQCRLYLTRKKVVKTSSETGASTENYAYRLFFYAYQESPSFDASDSYSDFQGAWCDILKCKPRRTSDYDVELQEHAHRAVRAAFVSVSIDDLMSVHHEVHDSVDMKKFIKNLPVPLDKDKDDCCSCCDDLSCCKINIGVFEYRFWKWGMFARAQQLDDLDFLVSGETYTHSKDKTASSEVYDPLTRSTRNLRLETKETFTWSKFHTINVTYVDNVEYNKKHFGVIVISPFVEAIAAIQLTCQLTGLIEDNNRTAELSTRMRYRKELELNPNNPLSQLGHLQQDSTPSYSSMIYSALTGGAALKIQLTYSYRVTYVTLFMFAFICMIISFAFSATNSSPILVLPGLYSLVASSEKLYHLKEKEYTNNSLKRDVAFMLAGFVTFVATAAGDSSSGGAVVSAFMFFQLFFRAVGVYLQFRSKVQQKEGAEGGNQLMKTFTFSDLV